MSELPVHIRWSIRRDMEQVLDIEQEAFEHPWTEKHFRGCLRQPNCTRMVADSSEDDRVVGYMVYELNKTRLLLLNLAVAPDVWRRGVGRQMIERLTGKLSRGPMLSGTGRKSIVLEISERNLRGQLFFRAMNFRCTRTLQHPFRDSDEDGYLMVYRRSLKKRRARRDTGPGRVTK